MEIVKLVSLKGLGDTKYTSVYIYKVLPKNNYMQNWGDGCMDKVLVTHVWGAKFKSPACPQKPVTVVHVCNPGSPMVR